MVAFSYSEHVDLYCSDKGTTLCYTFITSMFIFDYIVTKVINNVFRTGLCTLNCFVFVKHRLGHCSLVSNRH